ncbi:ParA family protein [Enterococcus faecalis]
MESTKILSVNNKKGGVGKTATAVNVGVKLSYYGRVLFIDADESGNATKRFTPAADERSKLSNLFRSKEVVPMNVRHNLDLISGSAELEAVNVELVSRINNTTIFLSYLNKSKITEKYDYIVIDTRNDSNIITNNMLVASDMILGVTDPSADGFEALTNLVGHIEYLKNELTHPISNESYVKAQVFFIGNLIRHNTRISRQFKEAMKGNPRYLGYFHDRTAFNEAAMQRISVLDLFEQKDYQDKKYDEFKRDTIDLIDRIRETLDTL